MSSVVRFGSFEADLAAGQLRKAGATVHLREQSFQVLASLLERRGEVVTREELHRRLWDDDVFVDFDNSLNAAVARLREALCDSPEHPQFIETIPRRGYRFLANVSVDHLPSPAAVTRRERLVVLPFVNLSGDSSQDYFSDAVTDELITEFAGVAPQLLAVIARTTAMHYKGAQKDVERIGRELDAAYLIEGGVRRSENQISLNVQLIQTRDQAHLFAKRYEGSIGELFALYRQIARDMSMGIPHIAERLRSGELAGAAQRRIPTGDIVAYNLYRQGRSEMYKQTPESGARAKRLLEQAIARDPQFALAYDAVAEFYWWVGFFGFVPPKDAFSAGVWAALRALEIDNTLAETHALLGWFRHQLDYNWQEAHREVEIARKLNPDSPLVRFRCAKVDLIPHARLSEAIAEIDAALQLDPLSPLLRVWYCLVLWLARKYGDASREAETSVEIHPQLFVSHLMLGVVARDRGQLDEAIAPLRKAADLSGRSPQVLGHLGLSLGLRGETSEPRALLQELSRRATTTYVAPTSFAWIHIGLGEMDNAFEWLARAVEERDPNIVPIRSFPFLDGLRSDERFADLLQRMHLEGPQVRAACAT